LILASTDRICIVGAGTLDPDIHVIGGAAGAKTVKDHELLQVGCVANLALLKVSTWLNRDAERVVEGAVSTRNGATIGAVGVLAVICCCRLVAAGVVAIVLYVTLISVHPSS
jgi:hypothetical protein